MSTPSGGKTAKVPVMILDDLSSKFLINLPEEEKSDLIRLFFQIELAHWFFLDFYCTQDENRFYVCGIKQFALNVFQHIPFLNHHVPNLNTILEEWRTYKMSVPTYGAILLTPDMKNCLLVQSFFTKNSWGFPKGKVNENEDPVKCAIREVYEETGFDCGSLINAQDFIEGQTSNYQYTRLYIVKNVPIDTKFCPRTRNEIKDCSWFVIDDLPNNRNDDGYVKDNRKIRANSFYMILPFISKLKHWISNERLAHVMGNNKKRHPNAHKNNNSNKKNHNNFQKQSGSPYFHNNNGNIDQQARRSRHKSTGDTTVESFSPATNSTFYNDHPKITSTPIANQSNTFMPSSGSAFRSTNSDNKLISYNKKKIQQQAHLQKIIVNGKVNQPTTNNNSSSNNQQDHIKRKLFNDAKENVQSHTIVKPFSFDGPECWKNFKFDHQKLFNSICM